MLLQDNNCQNGSSIFILQKEIANFLSLNYVTSHYLRLPVMILKPFWSATKMTNARSSNIEKLVKYAAWCKDITIQSCSQQGSPTHTEQWDTAKSDKSQTMMDSSYLSFDITVFEMYELICACGEYVKGSAI